MKHKVRQDTRTRAVALRYEAAEQPAPQVVAAGAGPVAERIIELAKEHGVPIHEDPQLVALLAKLDVGALIPLELYAVLAELLAFLYRVAQKAGTQGDRK